MDAKDEEIDFEAADAAFYVGDYKALAQILGVSESEALELTFGVSEDVAREFAQWHEDNGRPYRYPPTLGDGNGRRVWFSRRRTRPRGRRGRAT